MRSLTASINQSGVLVAPQIPTFKSGFVFIKSEF